MSTTKSQSTVYSSYIVFELCRKKNFISVARRAYTDSQVAFFASLRHSLRALSVHETVAFDDVSSCV